MTLSSASSIGKDAERVQDVLSKRLRKFALELEPSKTKLIKFGRFGKREAEARSKRPETFYFLGFVHYVTRNRKGNFKVGRKTEKSRLRRSLIRLKERMRDIRHWSLKDQVGKLNSSTRFFAVTMRTTAWRAMSGHS